MITKRFVSVVLSSIMVVLMLPVCGNMDVKGSALRLNYSYFKMTGGYSVVLKTQSGAKAKWKSTNKRIAKVSKNGKVTGIRKGKCTIIARVGSRIGKCKITVTRNKYFANKKLTGPTMIISKLRLDIHNISYDKLGESRINYKKISTYPLSLKNTKKKPKWKSKNKRIAKVSKKGLVTAVSKGETIVYAKLGKKKYHCKVQITDLKNPNKIENQKDAYEMLRRINRLRIKKKIKPLKILNRLMRAANKRAKELRPEKIEVVGLQIKFDKNFRHSRPDGRLFSSVIPEYGLPLGSRMGENISFVTDTVTERKEFLNTCFKAFLASKEHKKNMLSNDYSYIGIGHNDSIHFTNYHTHPCIAVFWDQLFYSKF